MRSFFDGGHYLHFKTLDFEEELFRFPDVPDEEMKKVKEKCDSSSKYGLCLCEQQTLLLVGSEKIPARYD